MTQRSPFEARLRERVPLAPRTTLDVGGAARFFFEAEREEDVSQALAWARARGVPVVILGGGSNLLVADRGVEALVVKTRLRGLEREELAGDRVRLTAAAGESWDGLVERAVEENLAGIECLSGIPGEVGATPIQNVGAYGQEIADTLVSVRVVARDSGAPSELTRAECALGYRDSVFKREHRDSFVVVAVTFELRRGGAPAVRYPELARALGEGKASLAEVRRVVRELRRAKSMLADQGDENARSAGSFFMNPQLDEAEAEAVEARAGALAQGPMPKYPGAQGRVKLSAAWLIERAGFAKGSGEGRVGLSTKHALAIVNRGGATAAEVVAFARRVQGGVEERFGVRLVPEPVMVGFEQGEGC